MNYIDIPLSLYNGKIPDDEFITDSVNYGKEILIDGNYPIENACIMTSDLNQIFKFSNKVGAPEMCPLMKFLISKTEKGVTPIIHLSSFSWVDCENGKAEFDVKACEIKPFLLDDGSMDFELLYADEEWLDSNGVMSVSSCEFIGKLLVIIVYIMSKMLNSKTVYEKAEQTQHKPTNNFKGENDTFNYSTGIISIGDRVITLYKDNEKSRQYTHRTNCWSVRGHYRHYKSGKVTYVPEYQKGQGKPLDRIYKIKEAKTDGSRKEF